MGRPVTRGRPQARAVPATQPGPPWKDEILLPALPAFALKDLLEERVQIGKTDNQVTLITGPWSFHCSVEAGGRFPRIDQILPKPEAQTTTLTIDPDEATFLVHTLPRLPRPEDDADRITLDMGQEIIVRASGQSEQTTDVVLTRSRLEGKKLRLCLGRRLLGQALELGIERFSFSGADKPVLGQEENRTYVWLPLADKLAVAASADCRRIEATEGNAPAAAKPRRDSVGHSKGNGVAHAPVNGKANGVAARDHSAEQASTSVPRKKHSGKSAATVSILEMSQKLREQARALAHGLNDMLKTIKAQRRQNRLVETTLTSLRQLKGLVV